MSSQNPYIEALTPLRQNVTVFGDRAFKEGMKVKWGHWWNFPGGLGVKTLRFQCKGCGFQPQLGNYDPYATWPNKQNIVKHLKKLSSLESWSVSRWVISDSLWSRGLLLVSSVHGILQARILEWVAVSFSRGSSRPWDWTRSPALQADSVLSEPLGWALIQWLVPS